MIDLLTIWDSYLPLQNYPILRSSNDNNTSFNVEYLSKPEIICIQIAYAIMCFLGITGNLYSIVAFLRSPELRSQSTTKFVISLAISDLLQCLIFVPMVIALYSDPDLIDSLCPSLPFFPYLFGSISLFTLMELSINRFVMICFNDIYQRIYTETSVYFRIISIWLCTTGYSALPLAGLWGKYDLTESKRCDWLPNKGSYPNPKKIGAVMTVFLPLIIMIICYTAIFIKVRHMKKKIEGIFSKKNEKNVEVLKMTFILFFCYISATIPWIIVNLIDPLRLKHRIHIIPIIILNTQAMINPFVYGFNNKVYKPAYKKLYQDICGWQNPPRRPVIS